MRIALFTETFLPKVDGIVTRLRHTVEHLERNGDRVLVVCPEGGLKDYKGAKIYGLSAFPLPMVALGKCLMVQSPSVMRKQSLNASIQHIIKALMNTIGDLTNSKIH